jgi:hypothetical protein
MVSIEDLEIFTLLLFLGPKSSFDVFRLLSLSIIRAAANAILRILFDPLMILTSHSPQNNVFFFPLTWKISLAHNKSYFLM